MDRRVAEAWDSEYEAGRYRSEPPVPFIDDIVAAAKNAGLIGTPGLYIGCGNGRNYLPLVRAGLDLVGLDVSRKALEQLAQRAPDLQERLVDGDLANLACETPYAIVIGIQVFQHGDRASTHSHIRRAQELVAPGGLFCLRVNADATDVSPGHVVTEQHDDGGVTVRYLEGAKEGLEIHFFSRPELIELFADGFEEVLPLRLDQTWRSPPSMGQWSQWEAIWRRQTRGRQVAPASQASTLPPNHGVKPRRRGSGAASGVAADLRSFGGDDVRRKR